LYAESRFYKEWIDMKVEGGLLGKRKGPERGRRKIECEYD
jgi:hypothetical protein